MAIPFETLLPYGIVIGMFCISGAGLGAIRYYNNGGKPPRYALGAWDRQMMERDRRLTGFLRGQSDKVEAPPGFELNNPWKVEWTKAKHPQPKQT